MSGPPSRFAPYRNALNAISSRTGTPLPSLIASFGILHELTAIGPLVGTFYGSRALGIGERVVKLVVQEEVEGREAGWLKSKFRAWIEEGDRWAKRVGTRYGIFGFQKTPSPGPSKEEKAQGEGLEAMALTEHVSERIAGDVANAVVAYAATKARLRNSCLR